MQLPSTAFLLVAVALFAVALLGGALPLCFSSHIHNGSVPVAYGNLFAGGVLVGVATLHMLPDALESLSLLHTLLLYGAGLAFVGLTDRLLSHHATPTITTIDTTNANSNNVKGNTDATENPVDETYLDIDLESLVSERSHLLSDDKESSFGTVTEDSSVACLSCDQNHENKDTSVSQANLPQSTTFSSALSLWLALTVHSLLEGASLGAQPDRLDLALGLFMHKGLVALAVAVTWRRYLWLFLSFCAMSPLGMVLGWLLVGQHTPTQKDTDSDLTGSLVAALAGGTFLYVGFHELLIPSWSIRADESVCRRLWTVSMGLMVVAVWTG